ncbi:serine/arginine repetitive matrix protein 5-like [Palaemon carinicauda]|uniref:serine/arginine repetitive matrix protein 5-like n=1 Tax=Palaemon carinicauda TaxID=392227 RepID=UPI0035B61487
MLGDAYGTKLCAPNYVPDPTQEPPTDNFINIARAHWFADYEAFVSRDSFAAYFSNDGKVSCFVCLEVGLYLHHNYGQMPWTLRQPLWNLHVGGRDGSSHPLPTVSRSTASLGLKGLPSKEALFKLIQLVAAVKQSPVRAEVDPLSIVDVVVAEASDGSGQTSAAAAVADVAKGSASPSEHPSKGKLSPTVSLAGASLPRGSALTETSLRRTDDVDALPRGRLHRKAHPPLRRRGLPFPYKGVRRHLFGSSSPPPSPAEDSSRWEQTVAATSLDLSADRSQSPTPSRPSSPSGLPSPLVADAEQAPSHPVTRRAPVPSGQRDVSNGVGKSLARHGSPARSAARLRAVAQMRSPELQPSHSPRQRSPARQCSPARQLSPSRQRSPASHQPPSVPAAGQARHRSPERTRSPARQRTPAHLVPDARPARQRSPTRPRSSDLDTGQDLTPSPCPRALVLPSSHAQQRTRSPVRTSRVPARPRDHESSSSEPDCERSPLRVSSPSDPAPQLTVR